MQPRAPASHSSRGRNSRGSRLRQGRQHLAAAHPCPCRCHEAAGSVLREGCFGGRGVAEGRFWGCMVCWATPWSVLLCSVMRCEMWLWGMRAHAQAPAGMCQWGWVVMQGCVISHLHCLKHIWTGRAGGFCRNSLSL